LPTVALPARFENEERDAVAREQIAETVAAMRSDLDSPEPSSGF